MDDYIIESVDEGNIKISNEKLKDMNLYTKSIETAEIYLEYISDNYEYKFNFIPLMYMIMINSIIFYILLVLINLTNFGIYSIPSISLLTLISVVTLGSIIKTVRTSGKVKSRFKDIWWFEVYNSEW